MDETGIAIPSYLGQQLRKEGSALEIRRAGEHNLDWNWRCRYFNGTGGWETTAAGEDLQPTLDRLSLKVRARQEVRASG